MLELKDITLSFNRGTPEEICLFRNLSVRVEEGDFVCVVGSNGAGKSTLLNLIAGAIRPDAGAILLDGADITRLPEHRRARRMGRVFQDPAKGTSPMMTVLENMALAQIKGQRYNLRRGVARGQQEQFAAQLRELNIGLEDKLNLNAGQLSGGQRQAVALLMAAMGQPQLLLLDEHTAALDPRMSRLVMERTRQLVEQRHMTAIMVTHNLSFALEFGNRLWMLHRGQLVYDVSGPQKAALTKEGLLEAFSRANPGEESDTMVLQ